MSAQHQGLDRKQQGLDAQQHCVHEPTSSGIIKLGTYVIFELIIREAVEQAVMCFGSNRRFKGLRVVSVVPPSAARIEMGAPTRLPSSQGAPKINSDFQK